MSNFKILILAVKKVMLAIHKNLNFNIIKGKNRKLRRNFMDSDSSGHPTTKIVA
jgi:hypothetical protein